MNCVKVSPEVSVVMAVYKGDDPRRFRSALNSLIMQSLRANIIVVVDGPVEESHELVLAEFKSQVALEFYFSVLRLPSNKGPAFARNVGIRNVTTPYVAIADADDVSLPERLELQLQSLLESGADLVGSWLVEVDDDQREIGLKRTPTSFNSVRVFCPFFSPVNNPTVFAKTNVFKSHPYPEDFRVAEDYSVWVDMLLAGVKITNVPAPLVIFSRSQNFLNRRTGLNWARTEFRVRLAASSLAPTVCFPVLILFSFVAALLRLGGPGVLSIIYFFKRTALESFMVNSKNNNKGP